VTSGKGAAKTASKTKKNEKRKDKREMFKTGLLIQGARRAERPPALTIS
jgi:hypothetical protein